jgi:mRNA interferase YafO
MDVKITSVLRALMVSDNLDVDLFLDQFAKWKSGDEYGSYLFGKDASYAKPEAQGYSYALRHVHLVPLADHEQLKMWDNKWRRRGRKTSDRALVYVEAPKNKYLLIFILDEPDAHAIAAMNTSEDRATMEGFLEIAIEFLETGTVIA